MHRKTQGAYRLKLASACLLSAVFFLFLALNNLAQPSLAQVDSVRFEDASLPLPTSLGVGMIQDHTGYLWIVTYQQLLRYDGYTYSRFYSGNNNNLFPGAWNVLGISGGRHDFLLIHSAGNAVLLYDIVRNKRHVVSLRQPGTAETNKFTCVAEDSAGRFWLGCEDGRVLRMDPPDSEAVTILGGVDSTIALPPVRSISEDSSGNIWIGSDRGLLRIHHGSAAPTNSSIGCDTIHGLPCDSIAGIVSGRGGRVWVGMRDGSFGWIDAGDRQLHQIPPLLLPRSALPGISLAEDYNRNLWVGTKGNGLYRWHSTQKRWQRYLVHSTGSSGAYTDLIASVIVDRSGVLWVLTNSRGLLRHVPPLKAFHSITSGESAGLKISGPDVVACRLDQAGTLWIGRASGGVDYLKAGDEKFGRFVHDPADPHSLSSNRIISICERRTGEMWIGTVDGGINVFDRNSRGVMRLRHDPSDSTSLRSDIITAMYEDTHANVWVGHYRGLDRFDPTGKISTPVLRWPEETLGLVGSVSSILEDTKRNLWVATVDRGLFRINLSNGDTVRYLQEPGTLGSLPGNNVRTVYEDPFGRLWIGTMTGVARFDYSSGCFQNYELALPRRYRSLDPRTPPPSDMQGVNGILADRRGNLWLSLWDGGVARFDVQRHLLRRYGRTDGVVVLEGRRNAFFMSRGGFVYCGGTGGLTWFHPDSITDDGCRSQVVVTQFRVLQTPQIVPPSESVPIVLDYAANTFTFEFAMLDFRKPEENQYFYILEGADPDWILSGRERTVTYANVPPGEYRFRVRGQNGDGVLSDNEVFVGIAVGRPYWQTWWFRLLAGGVIVGLIGVVYRREVTRLRRDRLIQQEFSRQLIVSQETGRKRLAAELHDGLGQDLLVASNELQQFLQEEKGSTEDVARAAALVQESIQNVREIASALHPHQLDRLGFCSAVKAMTQNIAHSSGLSIHCSCEKVDGILPKEKEIHVYRIIQEALSNIVRHAQATEVTLQARENPGNVEISVADNGRGFVQESKPMRAATSRGEEGIHGFGLSSMAERARIIGATFDVRSSPGSGTTVHLTVPHS